MYIYVLHICFASVSEWPCVTSTHIITIPTCSKWSRASSTNPNLMRCSKTTLHIVIVIGSTGWKPPMQCHAWAEKHHSHVFNTNIMRCSKTTLLYYIVPKCFDITNYSIPTQSSCAEFMASSTTKLMNHRAYHTYLYSTPDEPSEQDPSSLLQWYNP